MSKLKSFDRISLLVGLFLILLTSLNIYLGRTDFVEQGWIHLGLGIMAVLYGGRKFIKKNK